MTSPAPSCPACGAANTSGNFCNACGASLQARACPRCEAPLSSAARFCHKCGAAAGGGVAPKSEKTAWILAGLLSVAFVGGIVWYVIRGPAEPVTPDMANVGSTAGNEVAGRPPDISQMSPAERFDRLFDRVTRAAAAGDTVQIAQFTPMALGAYSQLETISNDDRFHAAMLHFNVADFAGALALADTIEANTPGHLFSQIIRGDVASVTDDSIALRRSYRDFLASYDKEMAANREEYFDHKSVIEEFHSLAKAQ